MGLRRSIAGTVVAIKGNHLTILTKTGKIEVMKKEHGMLLGQKCQVAFNDVQNRVAGIHYGMSKSIMFLEKEEEQPTQDELLLHQSQTYVDV